MFDARNSADTERRRVEDVEGRHAIVCPNCKVRLTFYRTIYARIDSCGFESYGFECNTCGAALAGIIDPYDRALLLSVQPHYLNR